MSRGWGCGCGARTCLCLTNPRIHLLELFWGYFVFNYLQYSFSPRRSFALSLRNIFNIHSHFDMAPSRASEEQYPPSLTAPELDRLVSTIKDWSIANGLAVRPPLSLVAAEADPQGVLATTAPVTLFPSPFPRVCFDQAKSIQKAYNALYASIAQDEEFLKGIVQE